MTGMLRLKWNNRITPIFENKIKKLFLTDSATHYIGHVNFNGSGAQPALKL